MDKFNPFGSNAAPTRSTVDALIDQVKAGGAIRLNGSDTREGAGKETLDAVRRGDLSAVNFSVSVGNGRGSTRLDLTGDHVGPVRAALRAWDPAEDLSELPPEECVRRTISSDGEEVTFKLSLAKNSRNVRIPVDEWPAFLDFMDSVGEWTSAALEHFRANLADAESGE